MKNVKKIFNLLLLVIVSIFNDLHAENYKVQYIAPQKESMEVINDPGAGILSMYSMVILSLNSYNRLKNKCSPYFPENELERNEANKARQIISDLKICYRKKTGKEITDQMVKEARSGLNTGGIDFNAIAMLEQFSGSAINPKSIQDAKTCSEKSNVITLTLIPLRFTEFPKSGWCNELK